MPVWCAPDKVMPASPVDILEDIVTTDGNDADDYDKEEYTNLPNSDDESDLSDLELV